MGEEYTLWITIAVNLLWLLLYVITEPFLADS
jgi:hypothetical protein